MLAYADKQQAAPLPLVLAWHAERFKALPEAGGILDQRAQLLHQIAIAGNLYDALSAYRRADDKAAWQSTHRDQWRIVSQALLLQAERNG